MFTLCLLFSIILACGLAYLYSTKVTLKLIPHMLITGIAWVIIYIDAMLMSNYLAVAGIPYSKNSESIDFISTLNSDFINLFVQMSAIYAIIASIYWVLSKYIKPYWFIAALGVFSILIYYPGIPYADTNDLYRYYLEHSYSDWQPPLYSLWWNIFNFYGSAFLVNTLSYYLGLTYISYCLNSQNKTVQNNLLVLFSLNPIFFTQLNFVLKDTLFAGLLIDTVAIYLLLFQIKNRNYKIGLTAVYFLLLFLAVGIRYNGITAILPFVALIAWGWLQGSTWSKLKKLTVTLIAALAICVLFVQANLFLTYHTFKASKNYTLSLVMQNDMANIECLTNHQFQIPNGIFVDQSNISNLRQEMCTPLGINEYNYDTLYNADWNHTGNSSILFGNHGETVYNLSRQAWLPAIIQHPFIYAHYRLRFILNDMLAQYYMPAFVLTKINEWPIDVAKPDNYNPIRLQVQQVLAKAAIAGRFDMRYLLGFFIIIGSIATLFYLLLCADFSLAFIVLMSNLTTLFGLYLVLGEHAARFFLWNDIATMLGIALCTFKLGKIKVILQVDKRAK